MYKVIKFSASWCAPCKQFIPVWVQARANFKNIKFVSYDVDEQKGLSKKYNVRSVPTIIILNDGAEVSRTKGVKSYDDFTSWIETIIPQSEILGE